VSLFGNDLSNAGITLGDNAKAIFGAGSDLQIYHDGSNSYIQEIGTGNLFIASDANVNITNQATSELKATFISNGAVNLYYDNAKKLATTNTGVDVTGGLNTTGNVGIGTSSPATRLSIGGSTVNSENVMTFGKRVTSAQSNLPVIGHTSHDGSASDLGICATSSGGNVIFYTGNDAAGFGTGSNTERMRIDSSGNVLVGTMSAIASGLYSSSFNGATQNGIVLKTTLASNGTDFIRFINSSGSVIGEIEQNGASTVAYLTSSDYRLKENVTEDWDATTRLKQLNPVRFNFIADADTTVDGFLAHEVQDIVPEAISGTKDGIRDEEYQVSAATGDIYTPAVEATYDEDGVELTAAIDQVIHSTDVERPEELAEGQQWRETTAAVMGTRSVPDYQGIDQSKLVPLLVKTIQELEARITALEAS
jgi:hypothetical protein